MLLLGSSLGRFPFFIKFLLGSSFGRFILSIGIWVVSYFVSFILSVGWVHVLVDLSLYWDFDWFLFLSGSSFSWFILSDSVGFLFPPSVDSSSMPLLLSRTVMRAVSLHRKLWFSFYRGLVGFLFRFIIFLSVYSWVSPLSVDSFPLYQYLQLWFSFSVGIFVDFPFGFLFFRTPFFPCCFFGWFFWVALLADSFSFCWVLFPLLIDSSSMPDLISRTVMRAVTLFHKLCFFRSILFLSGFGWVPLSVDSFYFCRVPLWPFHSLPIWSSFGRFILFLLGSSFGRFSFYLDLVGFLFRSVLFLSGFG